jgi:Pheophorbide a oxygenase
VAIAGRQAFNTVFVNQGCAIGFIRGHTHTHTHARTHACTHARTYIQYTFVCRYQYGNKFTVDQYAVPTKPGWSRIISCSLFNPEVKLPSVLPGSLRFLPSTPAWAGHAFQNNMILDGDGVLIGQAVGAGPPIHLAPCDSKQHISVDASITLQVHRSNLLRWDLRNAFLWIQDSMIFQAMHAC